MHDRYPDYKKYAIFVTKRISLLFIINFTNFNRVFSLFYFSRNYIFHSIKKKKLFYAIETTNYGIDRLKSIINNFKLIPTI